MVESDEEEKEPLDFADLARTLREAREMFLPLALDLKEMSVSVEQEGERVVEINGAALSHRPGEDLIRLEVGTVTDASERTLLSQKVSVVWEKGKLVLGKVELLPSVGVRNFELLLPEEGAVSANGEFRVLGAILRLDVGEGIRDVRVDLTEGALDFGNPLAGVGVGMPPPSSFRFCVCCRSTAPLSVTAAPSLSWLPRFSSPPPSAQRSTAGLQISAAALL